MVVLENFDKIDATLTWAHPTKEGSFVSACFVRDTNDKPFLVYCPCTRMILNITQEAFEEIQNWDDRGPIVRRLELNQELESAEDVYFYVIRLGKHEPTKISKRDLELFLDIQVVD